MGFDTENNMKLDITKLTPKAIAYGQGPNKMVTVKQVISLLEELNPDMPFMFCIYKMDEIGDYIMNYNWSQLESVDFGDSAGLLALNKHIVDNWDVNCKLSEIESNIELLINHSIPGISFNLEYEDFDPEQISFMIDRIKANEHAKFLEIRTFPLNNIVVVTIVKK